MTSVLDDTNDFGKLTEQHLSCSQTIETRMLSKATLSSALLPNIRESLGEEETSASEKRTKGYLRSCISLSYLVIHLT